MKEEENNDSKATIGVIIGLILIILTFVRFGMRQKDREVLNLGIDPRSLAIDLDMKGYEQCINSTYPNSCDSIKITWNTFKDSETEIVDKIMLLSPSYMERFNWIFANALYLNEDGFHKLNLIDKIKVVEYRQMILSVYKKEDLKDKDDQDLAPEFLFIKTGTTPKESFGNLEGVKFFTENTAIGTHKILGITRGITFEKTGGIWKINPIAEGEDFTARRIKDQARIAKQYGGERKFIEMVYGEDDNFYHELKSEN